LNHSRRTNRKEDFAGTRRLDRRFQLVARQGFAKPDDIRAEQAAAHCTARHGLRVLLPGFCDRITIGAADALNIAVQLEHILISRHAMQAVHILSDQGKFW